MCDAMETVEKIRILVGLNVDKYTVKIIDKANIEIKYEAPTMKEAKESFSESVEKRKDIFEANEKILFKRVSATIIATYDTEQ